MPKTSPDENKRVFDIYIHNGTKLHEHVDGFDFTWTDLRRLTQIGLEGDIGTITRVNGMVCRLISREGSTEYASRRGEDVSRVSYEIIQD